MAGQDNDFGELPPTLADFPRRWREDAVPALQALEDKRKGAVRFLILGIAGAGLLALAVLAWLAAGGLHPFEIFASAVIVIIGIGISVIPISRLPAKVKTVLIDAAMAATGLRFQHKGFEATRFGDFMRLKLTPAHDRRGFEDRIDGTHGGLNFTLYEAHLEQRRQSEKRTYYVTVFRGILGIVDYPSSALGETVLARDAGLFDKLSGPGGAMKRAGLGESRFEKIFTAWTTDQVEARYFLTPVVMETLLDVETKFSGAKIRGAFFPGEMIFALETGNWFEAGSMFKPLADPSRAKKLVEELGAIYHLIEVLKDCAPLKARV